MTKNCALNNYELQCYCNYKDADSGMSYHLSLVATPSNVVMRTNDLPFQWNVSSFMTTH